MLREAGSPALGQVLVCKVRSEAFCPGQETVASHLAFR